MKRAWLNSYGIHVNELHVVKYGTSKSRVAKVKQNAILVDDSLPVRLSWINGETIAAGEGIDLLKALQEVIKLIK